MSEYMFSEKIKALPIQYTQDYKCWKSTSYKMEKLIEPIRNKGTLTC